MNEMTNKQTTHQGGSVKKTLLVVALAAILVFVFTGSAFAEFNRSGQQRLGAPSFPTTEYGGLTGGWQSGGESAWVENLAPGRPTPSAEPARLPTWTGRPVWAPTAM